MQQQHLAFIGADAGDAVGAVLWAKIDFFDLSKAVGDVGLGKDFEVAAQSKRPYDPPQRDPFLCGPGSRE
jgi:hypothetical protein